MPVATAPPLQGRRVTADVPCYTTNSATSSAAQYQAIDHIRQHPEAGQPLEEIGKNSVMPWTMASTTTCNPPIYSQPLRLKYQ